MDTLPWDEELFHQWQQLDGFAALYLQSIRDDARVDHTRLRFAL